MPSLAGVIARFTNQTMVYWRKTGSNSYGRPIYADPVEIKVRWEDKEQEIVMFDGRTVRAKGNLLLGETVVTGSLVMLGMLTDWQNLPTYPNLPTVNQGARELIMVNLTPDIKARSYVTEAYF